MPKESAASKAIAVAFAILTVSVIAGTITMIIMYEIQIESLNATARPTIPTTTTGPPPVSRLPKNLIPIRYEVYLQPHLYTQVPEKKENVTSPNQTMLFTGNSTVEFHCVQTTKSIYLNSKDLNVSHPVVRETNSKKNIGVTAMNCPEDQTDFLEVHLNEALEAGGNYSLFLAFSGEISQNFDGLFLSTYEVKPAHENDTNTERFLVATNMEPTDARRVFPCFDEPEMKAVFSVNIIHREGTKALANGKLAGGTNDLGNGWLYSTFYDTPKMSTYLFAFTVTQGFQETPSVHERVKINTYARSEAAKAGHVEYAAKITGKILSFYESHLEIKYEEEKLDQIALPDLGPAAMENWGLITYQEGGLLYEEGVSSLLHKEVIATLIAHELAHQWFGNLVTMKWWNDIWLNEGFATYMSYFAVDAVDHTFKMKDTFIIRDLHTAFEEDALASSHPLSPPPQDIQTDSEINEMFDAITYSKGAMMLRMLADWVGETPFLDGVKKYLNDFKYKNTDQNDLWDCIEKKRKKDAGNYDIAKVMNTWTTQTGYPVITINTTNGHVYQKRFMFNDSAESSLLWFIPVRVLSESFPIILEEETATKTAFQSKNGEWILANINCTGYYRVNYDPENWERLLTQLETNPDRIPLMNRGQLVDDAFNLARAKLVDVPLALNSTRFLRTEMAYIPWESAVRNLEYFVLMFDRSEVYGPMQVYLREQVSGLYAHFNNITQNYSKVPEDHSAQHSQILAVKVACSNGLPDCLAMASKMFADWMNSNTPTNHIPTNLRSVIYCQALAAGGKKEWEFAWNKFQDSSDISEKNQLREALSCTKKIWLLNRYLEYTLNPDKIRLMDVASTINYIAANVAGQALAWNFIRAHWEYVSQVAASGLIMGVTSRFSTQFELEELEHFAASYDLDQWTMNQAIEQTKVNIQWVSEYKDVVLEWFEGQTSS